MEGGEAGGAGVDAAAATAEQHLWSNGDRRRLLDAGSDNSNEPLQLTTAPGTQRLSELGSAGSLAIFPVGGDGRGDGRGGAGGGPTSGVPLPSPYSGGAVAKAETEAVGGGGGEPTSAAAALPVRFVVEFLDVPPDGSGGAAAGRCGQLEDYAIVPASTRFSELTARVLHKCGLDAVPAADSVAYLSLRNWKPLPLAQVSSDERHTVADVLGHVVNSSTLRIVCRLPAGGAARQTAQLRRRLLQLLLARGGALLSAAGCPLDQGMLSQLTSDALPSLPPETIKTFNQWYETQQLNLPATQPEPARPPGDHSAGHCQSALDHFHQCSKPRVRTSFDMEYEIPHLQKWYSINPHPNKIQMQYYMEELNVYRAGRNRKPLEINNIIYWFKNSRAAQKKYEQRARSGAASPAPPDSDDCSLSASEDQDGADDARLSSGEQLLDVVKQEEVEQQQRERRDSAASGSPHSYHAPAGYAATPLSAPYINHMASSQLERIGGYGVDPSVFRQSMSMYMSSCLQGLPYPSVPLTPELQRKRNRTFIDPISEVPLLEKWFSLNTHPCHTTILQYTDELNRQPYRHKFPKLEPKNVQFWFKNRRAKNKRLRAAMWSLSDKQAALSRASTALEAAAKLGDPADMPVTLKAM